MDRPRAGERAAPAGACSLACTCSGPGSCAGTRAGTRSSSYARAGTRARTGVQPGMGQQHCLHRWSPGEREHRELQGQLVDAGAEPGKQQRTFGQRSTVDEGQ